MTDVAVAHVGPSGLVGSIGNASPDLAVGAISRRPFGPNPQRSNVESQAQ